MSKRKSIFIKIAIGIILLIAATIAISVFKRDVFVKELVILKLNKSLRNNKYSLYDYDLQSVKINLVSGDLKINGFKIFIKPDALDSLRLHEVKKRQLFEGEFNYLQIKGFDIQDLLQNEQIIANKIILKSPKIKIYINSDAPHNNTNKFDLDSVFSIIDPHISIKKVQLSDVNLNVFDVDKDSINTLGIDAFSFTLNDLKLDSTTLSSPMRVNYSSFDCGSGKTHLYINQDYSFTMNDFYYHSNGKILKFEGVNITHVLSKNEFKKRTPDDSPFYKISFDKLNIDLSMGNFLLDDVIKFKKVGIERLDVFVYQNTQKKIRPKKFKPLLASLIKSIPFPLYVAEIDLQRCKFSYEFQDKNMKEKSLKLDFDRSNITIKNITNAKSFLEKNHHMSLVATSYFLNKGKIDLTANFNLTSKIDQFSVKGHLDKMDFRVTNSIVETLAPVKFVNGQVHSLDFSFNANKYKSKGTMDFHYSNVKLHVLKENTKSKRNKNKPMLSMILNNILKKNNIPGHKKYKQGTIDTKFDPQRSILNYLWTSIKTGLSSSLARSKKK